MSKIICDVCGTSYPETAEQCPICGCVRPADPTGVSGGAAEKEQGYTYVKGGRFSKANVRKRTGAAQAVSRQSEDDREKSGKGLVITAAILLLAIIAVIIYIAFRFLMPSSVVNNPNNTTSTVAPTEVLCVDLDLDVRRIVFAEEGESRMLYVSPYPSNTTEDITYESSDEDIVTVNSNGKVTAVAPGEAWIIITCGEVSVTCDVECAFELETTADTTDETTETTEETTVPVNEELKLNRSDITFSYQGETWVIYGGNIPLSSITWTSGNESVCTITNGKVVAVGNGTTKVYAQYGDQKVECIIRCYFNVGNSGGGVSGGVSPDGEG